MGPVKHFLVSTVMAGGAYCITKEYQMAFTCIVSGVLTDTDHIIEYRNYCIEFHKKWDWKEFSSGEYFNEKKTVKVIFHSWEACIVAWLLVYLTYNNRINKSMLWERLLIGFLCGYTLHLCLDHIGNNLNQWAYFFIYRWKKDWKQNELLDKNYDGKVVLNSCRNKKN